MLGDVYTVKYLETFRREAVENWIREVKAAGVRAVRETTKPGDIGEYFNQIR